jgi:hypothetical protein
MRKVDLYRVAWIFAGLLLLSGLILSLGTDANSTNPAGTSMNPSGSSAFVELLRESGYNVEITDSIVPRLRPGDCAVAFDIDHYGWKTLLNKGKDFRARIDKAIEGGTNALFLPVPVDFQGASKKCKTLDFTEVPGEATGYRVTYYDASDALWDLDRMSPQKDEVTFGTNQANPVDHLGALRKDGEGFRLQLHDGMLATNRFIDKGDNAKLLLKAVSALVKPNGRVVFVEGYWGDPEVPGFLEDIGPWALGAWRQALFLFVVVCITLGRRFGLPVVERPMEQGGKDFVNGVSFLFERTKQGSSALKATLNRSESLIHKRLKIRPGANLEAEYRRLPPNLLKALDIARNLTDPVAMPIPNETGYRKQMPNLDVDVAFAAAQQLERELNAFLQS